MEKYPFAKEQLEIYHDVKNFLTPFKNEHGLVFTPMINKNMYLAWEIRREGVVKTKRTRVNLNVPFAKYEVFKNTMNSIKNLSAIKTVNVFNGSKGDGLREVETLIVDNSEILWLINEDLIFNNGEKYVADFVEEAMINRIKKLVREEKVNVFKAKIDVTKEFNNILAKKEKFLTNKAYTKARIEENEFNKAIEK